MQLSQNQLDTIAERAQYLRQEGNRKVAVATVNEIATEPWLNLTSPARDFVRMTVKATIQALESQGFEIVERQKTSGGAAR